MDKQILHPDQKALNINLDNSIYGTFAEIGAGQEVARNFFKVGAAAGTIAKTMSAYDKTYSDAIYGEEPSGRYVCETRLYKMLDHEFGLLEERLLHTTNTTKFFVFADTVRAINYQKTIKGNGWLGVRFQLDPQGKPNDLILHVKLKDRDNLLQQEAIGLLGTNMLYACYFLHDNLEAFVESLVDGIQGRVEVDMIRLSGPDFENLDNRLLALYLVKNGLTEVTMFDPSGKCIHASEFLYKKPLVVVRGHYKPPTLVSQDVFESSFNQFVSEPDVEEKKARVVAELTLENLLENDEISEQDFLERAKALGAMNYITIFSNCSHHQRLINYLADYKITKLGLVIGVLELEELIQSHFQHNRDGELLVAFGKLFTRNITVYVYPAMRDGELVTASSMKVPDGIEFLHKYLLESEQLKAVSGFNQGQLDIYSYHVRKEIKSDSGNWQQKLPAAVTRLIEAEGLFGYPKNNSHIEV